MFGLPADTVRKKFRTRCVRDNALNPIFDDEPFVFKKVVLPELASIRIAAYEEGGKFIGHRVLPVIGLCPGYKHVTLRTELGLPIPLSTLFLFVVVKVRTKPTVQVCQSFGHNSKKFMERKRNSHFPKKHAKKRKKTFSPPAPPPPSSLANKTKIHSISIMEFYRIMCQMACLISLKL